MSIADVQGVAGPILPLCVVFHLILGNVGKKSDRSTYGALTQQPVTNCKHVGKLSDVRHFLTMSKCCSFKLKETQALVLMTRAHKR